MRNLWIILFVVLFTSCGLFDGTDKPVSYIAFPNVEFNTVQSQGAATHNIKDLWIEMDGSNLGINAIPCVVPFITDNADPNVIVNAGIRNNGVQGTAVFYPFYKPLTLQTNFSPDAIETKILTFSYRDNLSFPLLEDFEGAHVFTKDEDDDPDSKMVATDQESRSGFRSGHLKVDESHPDLQVSSFLEINTLPTNGTEIYLELDYKNDVTFVMGLKGVYSDGSEIRVDKILIPPRDEWNKIYIDISQDISQADDFDSFRILFSVQLDEGASENNVFLDNIKLIHF